MLADVVDSIDDEAADNADSDRQEGNHDAESDVPEDNPGAGLPYKMQNSRHVLERANAVAPGVAGRLRAVGMWLTGFARGFQVAHGWGHAPLGIPHEIVDSEVWQNRDVQFKGPAVLMNSSIGALEVGPNPPLSQFVYL